MLFLKGLSSAEMESAAATANWIVANAGEIVQSIAATRLKLWPDSASVLAARWTFISSVGFSQVRLYPAEIEIRRKFR